MSMFPGQFGMTGQYAEPRDPATVRRLAAFFNSVYAWMSVGLAVTAVVAQFVSMQPGLIRALHGPMMLLVIVVQLGLVIAISAGAARMAPAVATVLFMIYAAAMGVTMSLLFTVYPHAILGAALAVTAGTFAVTSFFGFVTKADLSRLGGVLFMALIGLIIASVVNAFVASSALDWGLTYLGVLIFVGLTAYDTQRLKMLALQMDGEGVAMARLSIAGALRLYLDFLNLFIFMLRIMGGNDRR
jgi:uncharacterized protein